MKNEPMEKLKYVTSRGSILFVDVMRETEKAVLLRGGDNKRTAWFPKSGVERHSPPSGDVYLRLKNWMLKALTNEQFAALDGAA